MGDLVPGPVGDGTWIAWEKYSSTNVVAAVAQKSLKGRRVMGRSDDQDVANARQHQGGQRIIDHRLVIDRHQLFRDAFGQRIESCAGPAGQYNSLAHIKLPQRRSRCKVGGCRLQGDVAARNVWLCDGFGPERDSASGRQKLPAFGSG